MDARTCLQSNVCKFTFSSYVYSLMVLNISPAYDCQYLVQFYYQNVSSQNSIEVIFSKWFFKLSTAYTYIAQFVRMQYHKKYVSIWCSDIQVLAIVSCSTAV